MQYSAKSEQELKEVELLFLISNVKFIQIIKRITQVYMMYTFGDHNN